MNQRDISQYSPAFTPADASAANVVGPWFSLKNFNHIEFILNKAAGASGEPPTYTFEQAQDAAGTGAKALNFPQYSIKNAADLSAVTAGYTNVAVSPVANTITPAAGNTQNLLVVEFDAQNLDVANGFSFARVRIPDVGATAQLVSGIVRQSESRYLATTQNPYA
jgi:hypothetical protein